MTRAINDVSRRPGFVAGWGRVVELLDAEALERSPVVANCRMNRERQLRGSNGYERDLRCDVAEFLGQRSSQRHTAWADLCCGSGRALIEAAAEFAAAGNADNIRIEGVDLVALFAPNPYQQVLTLREASIEAWKPTGPYSLITCVHGLHYVGDKLAAIAKAAASLEATGMFVANLDLTNFKTGGGQPAGRMIASRLRKHGFAYDVRHRIVSCIGQRTASFGLQYLGADDGVGPNYTGQPAVASYYAT